MGIKVEGVSFNTELCEKMSKDEFIRKHSEHFADRSEEDRKRILSDAYGLIRLPAKSKKKPDVEKSDDGE